MYQYLIQVSSFLVLSFIRAVSFGFYLSNSDEMCFTLFFILSDSVAPTTTSNKLSLKLQNDSYFLKNSRFNSSFTSSQVLSNNLPLSLSHACYATDKNNDGDTYETPSKKSASKSKTKKSKSNDALSKNSINASEQNTELSRESKGFDKSFTKLKPSDFAAAMDDPLMSDFDFTLFSSNDGNNDSANGGSVSKGGSNDQKTGNGRKSSGSDTGSFINCLSCGLPCSKLDTECEFVVFSVLCSLYILPSRFNFCVAKSFNLAEIRCCLTLRFKYLKQCLLLFLKRSFIIFTMQAMW